MEIAGAQAQKHALAQHPPGSAATVGDGTGFLNDLAAASAPARGLSTAWASMWSECSVQVLVSQFGP
jgi:hypothetical protein